MDDAVLEAPGVLVAVNVDQVLFAQFFPTETGAVDGGLGERSFVLGIGPRGKPGHNDCHRDQLWKTCCCHDAGPQESNYRPIDGTRRVPATYCFHKPAPVPLSPRRWRHKR